MSIGAETPDAQPRPDAGALSSRQARRSLGRKLAFLFGVSVAVAIGLNTVVSLWREAASFAQTRREVVTVTAQVLAAAASDAVARRAAGDALAALRSIARIPSVTYTGVETPDGATLVELGAATRLDGDSVLGGRHGDGSVLATLWSRTISVIVPVVHGGVEVGRLVIVADASELWERLLRHIAWGAAAGAAALLVGFMVSLRLRRSITGPVADLIAVTRDIAVNHDYRRIIPGGGDDEIGLLVDDFNAMIREIRARDARLATHRANLEQEVLDRTADLRLAKDAAEAANAAKTEFLATMSHEIRTPLNGMLVMADLLNRSSLAPAQKRYASVVASSGKRLVAIIDDILDLSKVEAGKLTLELLPIDPAETVDQILMLFSERAAAKGLDLACSVEAFVPATVDADPVRLGQVIANLVGNALKFTDHGSVSVHMRRSRATPGELRIEVADTGIGIAADKLHQVFDAYAQADASTSRRFGGTGLGLSISRRIADVMGGRIDVASEEGRGASFTLVMPIDPGLAGRRTVRTAAPGRGVVLAVTGAATRAALAARLAESGVEVVESGAGQDRVLVADIDRLATEPTLRAAAARGIVLLAGTDVDAPAIEGASVDLVLRTPLTSVDLDRLAEAIRSGEPLARLGIAGGPVDGPSVTFPGRRVLVVDDNAVNREVAAEALLRFVCAVTLASGGQEAIQRFRTGQYDLILMDISMPGMDGVEAAALIRDIERRERRPGTPIVALTAYAAEATWPTEHMQGKLTKPFTFQSLGDCLSTHFHAGASAPPACGTALRPPERGGTDPSASSAVAERWALFLADGRREFVERVARLYCRLAPTCLADLRRAAEANDIPLVRERAHALRSMSLNMGVERAAALCQAIEDDAARGACPGPQPLSDLEDAVEGGITALEALLGGDGESTDPVDAATRSGDSSSATGRPERPPAALSA